MKKLILTTLIALILSVIPTSAEHRHRPALPQLEEGFNWNEVPVICGSHEGIMQKMERLNMNLLTHLLVRRVQIQMAKLYSWYYITQTHKVQARRQY